MEVIDINLDSIPLSSESQSSSVNFGSGIELLMNEKKKMSSGGTKIDLEELDNLETELNDLSKSENPLTGDTKQLNGLSGFSNMFNFGGESEKKQEPMQSVFFDTDSNLGNATKENTNRNTSTWDGFTKVSADIPRGQPSSSQLNEREKRRKKRMMIKKLEEWQSKGMYSSTNHYDMDSVYEEIEDEYEGALEEKRKKDSIKLQGWWFTTMVNTMEYGNALLNPFDLNLDGWGEQVSEDLDSYEEIFSELHEKYKGGKMAPELSLLLRLGFSATMVNMSNKMLSSATPGFNDVIKQSPELMKMFTSAAVDTMSQQNSAFDFAKTMMNQPDQVNTKFGPPPAPVETKQQSPPTRPGQMQFTQAPGNRPDISASKSTTMFREQGIDLNSQYDINRIDSIVPPKRQEMRGPQTTDIDQLLSGLKTKPPGSFENNIQMNVETLPEKESMENIGANDSIISLSSLKDMNNTAVPKTVRKRKSDKNTMSLDI